MRDHLPVAAAMGTGGPHREKALAACHLPAAPTETACLRLASGFTTTALARLAAVHFLKVKFLLHPKGGFQKI
jgi:hypothetical protein